MILNYIWISLILLAVLMGLVQALAYGNIDIFSAILNSTFDSAKLQPYLPRDTEGTSCLRFHAHEYSRKHAWA